MARVRFLLFALVVLALWGMQLFGGGLQASAPAVDQGTTLGAAGAATAALRVSERSGELRAAALRLVGTGQLVSLLRGTGKPEALTAEKFAPIHAAALEALPAGMRAEAVVGVFNEAGAVQSLGNEAPVIGAGRFDLARAAEGGADGIAIESKGKSFFFFSVPIVAIDRADPKVLGTLVLGAPAITDGLLKEIASDFKLRAVAMKHGEKWVAHAGDESSLTLVAAVAPGSSVVVERGDVSALGPFRFPLMTAGDVLGGQAPLAVASRQTVRLTPFEVVAIADLKPALAPLAGKQRQSLLGFLGLMLLTAVFAAWIGPGTVRAEGRPEPFRSAPVPLSPEPTTSPDLPPPPPSSLDESDLSSFPPPPAPDSSLEEAPQEPAPDAEAFPEAEAAEEGADVSPSSEAPPFHDFTSDGSADDEHTLAYVVPPQHSGGLPGELGEDFNPEQTRVATIPQELLEASARNSTNEVTTAAPFRPAANLSVKMPPIPVAALPVDDEGHFQEVYRDFVATREQCGEPADGLNFEKFAQKLRKNRDQLIQKYACRTVRFAVYVKDGKAALKATPQKD